MPQPQTPIIVVTAVIGDATDPLTPPLHIAPGVEYYCFSDRPRSCPPWQIRRIVPQAPPVWCAREIKIRLHRFVAQAAISVWQDAAYQLQIDPREFIPLLADVDMLMLPHPYRQSIHEEAAELQRIGLVPDDRAARQADLYHATYTAHGVQEPPLLSTGLLVRRHTDRVNTFSDGWWNLLVDADHPRDQMSVNFAAYCNDVSVGHLTGHYRDNPYAHWTKYTHARAVVL